MSKYEWFFEWLLCCFFPICIFWLDHQAGYMTIECFVVLMLCRIGNILRDMRYKI